MKIGVAWHYLNSKQQAQATSAFSSASTKTTADAVFDGIADRGEFSMCHCPNVHVNSWNKLQLNNYILLYLFAGEYYSQIQQPFFLNGRF